MRIKLLSFLYRSSRYTITHFIYFFQKILFRPRDLETAVKVGDKVLGSFFIFKKVIFEFPIPAGNDLEIYGLKFPSPLVGASFKADKNILDMWLQMGIGSIIFKTIMKEERNGNPRPRLQEIAMGGGTGIFNSLGLPGPGIKNFSNNIKDHILWDYHRPLGISIGGDSISDYIDNIHQIQRSLQNNDHQYYYELNISCPNTDNGQTICEDPGSLQNMLSLIRENISQPISIKVSPDVSDSTLDEIGEVCRSFDQMIINTGNTHYKKISEINLDESNFSMKGGGLSGTSIFNRTIEMVNIFSKFNMPIMATGGISKIEHVNRLKESGANLFAMATGLVLDPYCIPRINRQL